MSENNQHEINSSENNSDVSKTTQKLKWSNLYNYRKDELSVGLCISEFIDNSIESMERENKDFVGLKIRIEFYYSTKDKILKYIIRDNANGIEDIDYAMTVYKDADIKNKLSKSNYGFGMKSGIFWLGENGKVYSKILNGDEQVGIFEKGDDDTVINNVSLSNDKMVEYQSGTTIVIDPVINENKRLIKTDKLIKKFLSFIGYRYSKYLKDKKMEIDVITKMEDGNKTYHVELISFFDEYSSNKKALKLTNFVNKTKCDKDILIKKINEMLENDKYNSIKPYLEKFKNDEYVVVDDFLEIHNSPIKIPIKMMILNESSKRDCGLSILQSNRYIRHPVEKDDEFEICGNYPWTRKNRYKDERYRWLFGEIQLEKIPYNIDNDNFVYIGVNQNKKDIVFLKDNDDEKISKNKFDFALVKLIDKLDDLIHKILIPSSEKNNSDGRWKKENENAIKQYRNNEPETEDTFVKGISNVNEISSASDGSDSNYAQCIKIKDDEFNNVLKIKLDYKNNDETNSIFYEKSDDYEEDKYDYGYIIYKNKFDKFFGQSLETIKVNVFALISLIDIELKKEKNTNINLLSIIERICNRN